MPIKFLSIILSLFAVAVSVAAQDTTMVVSDALSDSLPQDLELPIYFDEALAYLDTTECTLLP